MTEVSDGRARGGGSLSSAQLTSRRRAATPLGESAEGLPVRRQWGRLVLGAGCTLLGGWLFAALYLGAGRREPVVVVARDVEQFEVIEEGDLTTERVAAGDKVETIPGSRVDDLIGRTAATDLLKGTVVARSEIVKDESKLVGADQAVVGIELRPGDAPGLAGGDEVRLVIVAGTTGEDQEEKSVAGWVLKIGEPDERRGNRLVEVVVDLAEGDEAQAASHQGRVAVYAVRGG